MSYQFFYFPNILFTDFKALEKEIDLIFFGMNLDINIGNIDPFNFYVGNPYENILELTKNMGLYDCTVLVDNQFCIYYPWQIEMDRVHGPTILNGWSFNVPSLGSVIS